MMRYWGNLNERERLLVLIGGIFLLAFVLYQGIAAPLSTKYLDKKRELQEKRETLVWMQQQQQTPLKETTKQSISSSKFLSLIATQLNTKPFIKFPHQLQQTSLGHIQLSFDKVPYTAVLLWLWKLENNYAFVLKQMDISRTKTPGVVKVLVLIDPNM